MFKFMSKLDDPNHINTTGSGIGLNVWKMLTNLLGGDITLKSIYGKGSKFTFFIQENIN